MPFKKMLMVFFLLGLGFSMPAWSAPILKVMASFSILADLTEEVGGERVMVSRLISFNQDAHHYQPTPQDLLRLKNSQVFIYNGLGFESGIERLLNNSGFKGKVIVTTQGIPPLKVEGKADPHMWHDPTKVQQYVQTIAEGLSQADPAGRAFYFKRAQRYQAQLLDLDRWAHTTLSPLPAHQRKVISSHDAFAYLSARYKIQFLAPQGRSMESEASAKTVAGLVKQMRQTGIRALFVENISNPKLIQQLGRESGTEPMGELYSDALSEKGGKAASYLALMRYNIHLLHKGMQKNQTVTR